jgi:plasmid stabilization system protein ParE
MAVTVRFLRLATRDLDDASRWYLRRNPRRAQRFAQAVDRAVKQIANAPDRWPVYQGPFRWVRAGRFPYILYYRILDPSTVLIYAVSHTSRRPGYWKRRSPP